MTQSEHVRFGAVAEYLGVGFLDRFDGFFVSFAGSDHCADRREVGNVRQSRQNFSTRLWLLLILRGSGVIAVSYCVLGIPVLIWTCQGGFMKKTKAGSVPIQAGQAYISVKQAAELLSIS